MSDYNEFYSSYMDYLQNPSDYKYSDIEKLQEQAQKFGVQFSYQDPGFSAVGLVKNFSSGLLQGFSTLPIGSKPINEVEGIAHSLGHLIGFIGGIPAGGPIKAPLLIGKGLQNIIRGGGVAATKIASRAARPAAASAVEKAAAGAASFTGKWLGKSAPMAVADAVMDRVGKTAISSTMKNYITGDITRQMVRHGAHLGTASMVSGWSDALTEENALEGMKSIMLQGITGAGFGATFGAIGNIKIPGVKTMSTMDKTLKALAGATFQATPGAIQGATTPENLYNFLLGAYFGSRAQPALIEKAQKFMQPLTGVQKLAVETNAEFLKLPENQQKAIIEYRDFHTKRMQVGAAIQEIAMHTRGAEAAFAKSKAATGEENSINILGGRHKGESGTIIKETPKQYKVQLDAEEGQDGQIINIKKDYASFKAEIPPIAEVKERVAELEQEIDKMISEQHDYDSAEIATLKPAQQLLEKMLGKKDISDIEYLSYLRGLNELVDGIMKSPEATELGELSNKDKKKLLLEASAELKEVQDAGLELTRAKGGKDKAKHKYAIGNIRTPEDLQRQGLARRAVDAIKKEFLAKGRDHITIEANETSERFWEKMGFYRGDETREGYPIDPSKYSGKIDPPTKPYGRFEYHYDITSADAGKKPSWAEVSKVLLSKAKQIQKARGVKAEEFTEDDLGQFRQYYIRQNNSILVPRKSFNSHSGAFENHDIFDGKGNRIDRREPMRLINELFKELGIRDENTGLEKDASEAFFVVKKMIVIKDGEKKEIKISDKVFETKEYKGMIQEAMAMGYYPYSGKGESDQIIFMHLNTTSNPKKELSRIRSELKKAGLDFDSEYKVLRDQAILKMDLGVLGGGKIPPIKKIISGAQFGPDMVGLEVGKASGLETGGQAPPGYAQQRGTARTREYHPELGSKYGLTEGTSVQREGKYGPYEDIYTPRTEQNIKDSDGTVIFGELRGGTKFTFDKIRQLGKKVIVNPTADQLVDWAIKNKIKTLNVAGNRDQATEPVRDVLTKALQKKPLKTSKSAKETYDNMFISNIRWWEAQNRLSISEMMNKGKGEFLRDLVEFNKRQQPLFSDFHRLTEDTFSKPFNYILINDFMNSKDPKVKKIQKWLKEHSDGGALIRDDVLKAMLIDMGLPSEGGFGKPFFNSPGTEGLLIGKLALHGAGKEMSKAMKDNGIDMLVPETVAKQRGNRRLVDYDFDPGSGKMRVSSNGKDIDPYSTGDVRQMNPKDIMFSFGIYDAPSHKLNTPIRIFKGIQDVLVNPKILLDKDSRKIYDEMREWIEQFHVGKDEWNNGLAAYLSKGKQDKATLEKPLSNFDDIGLKNLNDALWNESKAGVAFREAAFKKIFKIAEDGMEDKSIEITQEAIHRNMADKISSTMLLLKTGGHTDAGRGHKLMADYADRALTNYFIKRVTQPKVQFSGKAIMRLYDIALAKRTDADGNTSRLIKDEDVFFLDEGFRNQIVEWKPPGKKKERITIEGLWELYKGLSKTNPKREVIEKALTSIVVRSPMNSLSGLAELRFKGFTGRQGGGILLHPKIMGRLGGADLDIDSANFYMNVFPEGLRRIAKKYKDELVEIHNHAKKEYGSMDALEELFISKPDLRGKNSQLSMYDPYLRIQTANAIQYAAGKMRGVAVNNRQYIRLLYMQAKKNGGKYEETIKSDLDSAPKGTRIIYVARDSHLDLMAKSIAAVNVSVDVGHYGGMVQDSILKGILMHSAFKHVEVVLPNGQTKKMGTHADPLKAARDYEDFFTWRGKEVGVDANNASVNLAVRDTYIGRLARTQSRLFSWNFTEGRAWRRDEKIDAARNHPTDDFSHMKYLADTMMKLDYNDSFYARVANNLRGFEKFFNKMNRILKQNPELTRFLPANKDGEAFVFKIPLRAKVKKKRDKKGNIVYGVNGQAIRERVGKLGILDYMEVLSDWYHPNPRDDAYRHTYNIATEKGKRNLAMDEQAWSDFTATDPKASRLKGNKRLYYINRVIRKVNHFISNDLWDLASIKTINEVGEFYNIPFDYKSEDSLFKKIFSMSQDIKHKYRQAYREATYNKEASPSMTAYDYIQREIEGYKAQIGKLVDAWNVQKGESRPEVTHEGANLFFEATLLGSVGAGKDTRVFAFQPMFASRPVLEAFQRNYKGIFTMATRQKPSEKKVNNYFRNLPDAQLVSAFYRNISYIKEIDLSFPKGTNRAKLDPEVRQARDEILELLSFYGNKVSIENFVKMIQVTQGVANLRDMTVENLLGLRDEMKSWRYGKGWFRFMSRSKYFPEMMKILTGGKIKIRELDGEYMIPGFGMWVKPTETVASDTMRNDLIFIDQKLHPVQTVTKDKHLKTVFVDAQVPMSHMGKLMDNTARLHEHSNELGVKDEKILEKTIYPIRSIKNKDGVDETDLLVKLAVKEYELQGAIDKRDRLRDSKAMEEDIIAAEADVERYFFRKSESAKDYDRVRSLEYSFKDKQQTGDEVIKSIKNRIRKLYSDYVYDTKIAMRDDFNTVLITTRNNKGQRLDLNIRATVDKNLKPFLQPGAEGDPTKRSFSLTESKYFWYENHLDLYAREHAKEITKLYRLSEKDVRSLKNIEHEMSVTDLNGDHSIWFAFKPIIENGNIKYRSTYLRSLNRFLRSDDMFLSRLYRRLQREKKRGRSMSTAKKAMLDAAENFFKITKDELAIANLTHKEIRGRVSAISRYFNMKSNVPYKKGQDYSQYDMDLGLARKEVDDVFYLKERLRHDMETEFRGVGYRENYWPHVDFNDVLLERDVERRRKLIMDSDLSDTEKMKAAEGIKLRGRRMVSEASMEDRGLNEHETRSLFTGKSNFGVGDGPQGHKQLQLIGGNKTTGNMLQRKNNLDGYSYDLNITNQYLTAINRAIASNLSSIMAENTIRNFVKANPMGEYTKDWEMYMRVYGRDATGSATTATDEMLDSKTLNLRNTPWWWLSDQFYFESSKHIRKAVISMNHMDKATQIDKDLYELKKKLGKTDAPNFDAYWKAVENAMYTSRDEKGNLVPANIDYFSSRLRSLAQAEGKWALASLLARAKVSVANVMGGGTNLWVYAGARNIWNANNIDIWRDINPNTDEKKGPVFRTMEDVWNWAHGLGVVEEMVRYEAGLQQSQYKKGNFNRFINDAVKKISKDPNFSDQSLMQLAKQYKISDFVFNKAAWFMRSSERQLRTRSFLAGYLQARENMQPVEFALNDPWLIAQGKKAIKVTQFYYHAPYRPAFARSSAGKVFNRFKLWTWNSAKFRREVYQEAKYRGFQPGSVEFGRLQRLRQADAFTIGLAGMLPYTMFDYSLPAPYSYLQDLADWSFGDDKQRERAYFGVLPHALAPLHIIMPSILRGPEMVFGSAFTGQWDRLATYTMISYFPFGMMARDLVKAYQSPSMFTEFTTGIPLHRIQRAKQDVEKGKKAPAMTPTIW